MAKKHLKIGEKTRDGHIIAGYSPEAGCTISVVPVASSLDDLTNADELLEKARKINKKTQKGYRTPTPSELKIIFENIANVELFRTNAKMADNGVSYLTSEFMGGSVRIIDFPQQTSSYVGTNIYCHGRLVRNEPNIAILVR